MTDQPSRVSPWLTDVLFAIGVALAVAIVIAADLGGSGADSPGPYGFALGFGLLILLRRRFPLLVLIATVLGIFVYYALGYPAIGISLPAAAAIYSAAEASMARQALAAGAVLVTVAAYFRITEGLPGTYLVSYEFLTNVALLAAAVALGVNVRMRREARAQQERLNALTAAEHARAAERRVQEQRMNLARDLHDIVGHTMSVISVHSNVAAEAIGRDDDAAARAVAQIRSTTSHTMRELRSVVKVLRSPEEALVGIAGIVGLDGIAELADSAREAGFHVETDLSVPDGALSGTIEAAAYRLVQESLTNTIRHSGGDWARVTAGIEGQVLQVTIVDNGSGTAGNPVPETGGSASAADDPLADADQRDDGGKPSGSGHGIAGMRERVALLGGYLTAGPVDDGGFQVKAQLPTRLLL
ncbi:sensor histidine kinase [Arthrobacter castelli]|uniref:sensor histidine kinase n=1 Tax=Arthrobacter castelli TaxID=271431 RepID=UPI0005673991|nr:histidine kinase [Arthrobacter castelli]